MSTSGLHYFPLTTPYMLVLAAIIGLWLGLIAARLLQYASVSMGMSETTVLLILLLSLALSYVNIPVESLPEREVESSAVVSYFGMKYVVPVVRDWPETVLAVNLGGAVVPVLLSLYLVVKHRIYGLALAGVAVVSLVCHQLAYPVPRLGIAIPTFVPPLTTAIVALALSRRHAGPLAYISGSLGTLIGADLMNLGEIHGIGAPVASIGGAGTFDGIFLNGLLALLYASIATRFESRRSRHHTK
jgi:uncharacterized membrane protein